MANAPEYTVSAASPHHAREEESVARSDDAEASVKAAALSGDVGAPGCAGPARAVRSEILLVDCATQSDELLTSLDARHGELSVPTMALVKQRTFDPGLAVLAFARPCTATSPSVMVSHSPVPSMNVVPGWHPLPAPPGDEEFGERRRFVCSRITAATDSLDSCEIVCVCYRLATSSLSRGRFSSTPPLASCASAVRRRAVA